MSAPKRIQMTRQGPWRAANPDAVIVDRRTRWGNWYKPMQVGKLYQLQKYRDALPDPKAWIVVALNKHGRRDGHQWGGFADEAEASRFAVDMHARSLRATRLDLDGLHHHEYYMGELRGHDLACWCPLDQPWPRRRAARTRQRGHVVTPAECTDPQPIPVRLGTEAVQCICSTCRWRSPIVGDRRSARQGFDAVHGEGT